MISIWEYLKDTSLPIVLYGTGNGADKILNELIRRDIRISGIFASSGFVRDRSFRGFKVEDYETLHARFGRMIVLICFGTSRQEVLENIDRIACECEVYAPDVPVYGQVLFEKNYYLEHEEDFRKVREMLSDELSKETLDAVIDYKLSGKYTCLRPWERPAEEIKDLIRMPENSTFADLGAYIGDTVEFYTSLFPTISRVIAVEPDARNFRKLSQTTSLLFGPEREKRDREVTVSLVRAVVSDSDGTAFVPKNLGRGVHENVEPEKGESLTAISLVTLLKDEKADLIKLDVEGNEQKVIEGGRSLIQRDRPALIVSCYHRSEDLITLPLLIKELVPEYKAYMRHHPHLLCWDTEYIFTL